MNNKNSIIGCGYIPRDVEAICLKTKREAELGEVEYTIIAEPYEDEWGCEALAAVLFPKQVGEKGRRMAVNVLDKNTGLTYAVEYEPANLVRKPVEYSWEDIKMHLPKGMRIVPINEVPDKKPFIDRAKQIVEELEGIFNAGGGDFGKVRCCIFCDFGQRRR